MKAWERDLVQLIVGFESRFGCRPTAILAWRDAYSRIKADWQNVVIRKDGPKIIWKGYDVLLVDAPGDRIVLDGGILFRDYGE